MLESLPLFLPQICLESGGVQGDIFEFSCLHNHMVTYSVHLYISGNTHVNIRNILLIQLLTKDNELYSYLSDPKITPISVLLYSFIFIVLTCITIILVFFHPPLYPHLGGGGV